MLELNAYLKGQNVSIFSKEINRILFQYKPVKPIVGVLFFIAIYKIKIGSKLD